jgi:hypothetical protein
MQLRVSNGKLLKSLAAWSWNVCEVMGISREIPEFDLKVLEDFTMFNVQ